MQYFFGFLNCASRMVKHILLATFIGLLTISSVTAATFPAKPLRIIVPAAAGGNLDLVTRNLAQQLSEQLGKPVVVENKPGGSYKVAVDAVKNNPPDGYTYLAIADSFLYAPLISKASNFQPLKDFAPVSIFATVPQILVVQSSMNINTVNALIELARQKPGELNYGSAGVGTTGHLAGALFNSQAGIAMTHVPYKGNAPALIDLVGGRLSLIFDTISTSLPLIKSNSIKPLAVTSLKRSVLLPDVPTVDESGLPGYEAAIFNGLVAPVGVPPEILTRMNNEIRKAVQNHEMVARLREQGIELTSSGSTRNFAGFLQLQSDKYAKIIQSAKIKAD